jgi:hypothetical protein
MNLRVTVKTTDLRQAIEEFLSRKYPHLEYNEKQSERILIFMKCSRWFWYGENVELEIDLDKETCRVVENF